MPMWIPFIGLLFILYEVSHSKKSKWRSVIKVNLNDPSITRWSPYVTLAASAFDIPVSFAMAWIGVESTGNPCSVGEKTVTGPDGYPQEVGLFQIYNPDDFNQLGAKASELCEYCVIPPPGTPNPERLSKTMTDEQIGRHIGLGISLIILKREYAQKYMDLNKVAWDRNGPDYWRMVKLVHALPSIVNTGLGQVVQLLGRAPQSWNEFRQTYEKVNPKAKFNTTLFKLGKSQSVWYRALDNAEWTGGHVG